MSLTGERKVMGDPEIDAMSQVAAALSDLEDEAQGRVLRWAVERYGVALKMGGKRDQSSVAPSDPITDEEIAEKSPTFEHFAELFAAAQPKTNDDKALVTAYWVQVIQGRDTWASRLLSAELKNLGHKVPNITHALTSNMQKKPQRVIQLQKSGNAKQANKVYKVTHEGIVYVQGMIGHGG